MPALTEFTTNALTRPDHRGSSALAVKADLPHKAQKCPAETHTEWRSPVPVVFPQAQHSKIQASSWTQLYPSSWIQPQFSVLQMKGKCKGKQVDRNYEKSPWSFLKNFFHLLYHISFKFLLYKSILVNSDSRKAFYFLIWVISTLTEPQQFANK